EMIRGGVNPLSDRRYGIKNILMLSLPCWFVVLGIAYYVGGWPAFWGALIGLVMVAAYFAMGIYTAGRALEKSVGLAQVLVMGGFWIRLTILGVVVYLLSLVKGINLMSAVLTFAIGYSIVLPVSLAVWLPTEKTKGGQANKTKHKRTK
ncbi:MAG: ATP synthase subunit I, partial [Chloroflexi bacterium]|nr:ATP synthase subunit I [Chloroflexota bacterium]